MPNYELDYKTLQKNYGGFIDPLAIIEVNGVNIADVAPAYKITDIEVETTCGFEASIASFCVHEVFNTYNGSFKAADFDKSIKLGMSVVIKLGYATMAREVFRGFVSRINYIFPPSRRESIPHVQVTCMDIKGLMMSNTFSRQIKGAKYYSEAVDKILKEYSSNDEIITKTIIEPTPDVPPSGAGGGQESETSFTLEQVNETDYEYVVKVAKRFNYEFFTNSGTVVFRPARRNADPLIQLGPNTGLLSLNVNFDMAGLYGQVVVRTINPDDGTIIESKQKNSGNVGKHVKNLIKDAKKVYIDPTIQTKDEAQYRAQYLAQKNAYNYSVVKSSFVGIPELTPGRFIGLQGFYKDNGTLKYYIESVRHTMSGATTNYNTEIICRACDISEL